MYIVVSITSVGAYLPQYTHPCQTLTGCVSTSVHTSMSDINWGAINGTTSLEATHISNYILVGPSNSRPHLAFLDYYIHISTTR